MSRLSLSKQIGVLRSYFPESKISRKLESELIWIHDITPTPLSCTYKVKIHYIRYKSIIISVLEPKPLPFAKGETKLPHVYSTPRQELCLYYPEDREWDVSMFYAHTLIPWTSEWLFHYEIWAATGKWNGGGIEHDHDS